MTMLLSQSEKDRFVGWLNNTANTADMMAEQLKKLGDHGEIIAKKERAEALACRVVAKMILSGENMTIGGGQ